MDTRQTEGSLSPEEASELLGPLLEPLLMETAPSLLKFIIQVAREHNVSVNLSLDYTPGGNVQAALNMKKLPAN